MAFLVKIQLGFKDFEKFSVIIMFWKHPDIAKKESPRPPWKPPE